MINGVLAVAAGDNIGQQQGRRLALGRLEQGEEDGQAVVAEVGRAVLRPVLRKVLKLSVLLALLLLLLLLLFFFF